MKYMFLFLLLPIDALSQDQYSIRDLKDGKFKEDSSYRQGSGSVFVVIQVIPPSRIYILKYRVLMRPVSTNNWQQDSLLIKE